MGLGKSLNQNLQGGLENIGYTSSNGPPGNCYKVSNKYLIGHVLEEQNEGSTLGQYIQRGFWYVDIGLVDRPGHIPCFILGFEDPHIL